jgi:hypothetical protein
VPEAISDPGDATSSTTSAAPPGGGSKSSTSDSSETSAVDVGAAAGGAGAGGFVLLVIIGVVLLKFGRSSETAEEGGDVPSTDAEARNPLEHRDSTSIDMEKTPVAEDSFRGAAATDDVAVVTNV